MIRPPGFRGAAFTSAADGDLRDDRRARRAVSRRLGITDDWVRPRQVHGSRVVHVQSTRDEPGEADGLLTTAVEVPIAVLTADCVPVVLEGDLSVAVAHAGWRGVVAGVVTAALDRSRAAGPVRRAAIGPSIGPCCYEVGPEVSGRFPESAVAETTWGTVSVDLREAIRIQIDERAPGVDVWSAAGCTRCGDGWFSHRATGTPFRQGAVGWIPA